MSDHSPYQDVDPNTPVKLSVFAPQDYVIPKMPSVYEKVTQVAWMSDAPIRLHFVAHNGALMEILADYIASIMIERYPS